MTILNKISGIDLRDKEYFSQLFAKIINDCQSGKITFQEGVNEYYKYYLVHEPNRKGCKVITIVPKEIYELFKELQVKAPNEFLGYTILVNGIRVTGFGIPCDKLGKSLLH